VTIRKVTVESMNRALASLDEPADPTEALCALMKLTPEEIACLGEYEDDVDSAAVLRWMETGEGDPWKTP
jgi:hypothetical protein